MSTENSSNSASDVQYCDPTATSTELYNQISLGPAVAIVIVLVFMKRRVQMRKNCCDGRPGIQVPVDFLGDEQNRFSYGFAYGAMAVTVTNMFLNTSTGVVFTIRGSPYIRVFQNILTVLCIGTIYLPIFMGLSTSAKILGAVLGFVYTFGRLVGLFVLTLRCPIDYNSKFIYWPIFYDLPTMVCHAILLIRFMVIFVEVIRDKCYRKKVSCRALLEEDNDFKVGSHYVNHVKTLLQGVSKTGTNKWYIKGRNFVYTPEPHFKYSVAILSTVIVASIIIYEFVIVVGGTLVGLLLLLREMLVTSREYYVMEWGEENYEVLMQWFNIFIVSFLVSCILSALFTYFQMYRMLVSHRNHVIKLIKSDRSFLPRSLNTPDVMVGMSLRFCGYQIAYFLWGFLILMGVLLILVCGISAAILFLPTLMGADLDRKVKSIGLAMIPTVVMAVLIWLVQQILARFVFKDRSLDSKVVNIDNRRCFLLISFYFFFFNVLVGLMSCMLRILKGMILGVLFIGRIDRPLIMKGFTNLDTAYVAYIGFVHLQVAHKHPVVLVFSHLLWSGMRRKRARQMKSSSDVAGIDHDHIHDVEANGWTELRENRPIRPRVSASALNRWFIAVTVIRNPILIYNRKGFLKHILLGIPNSPTPSREDHQPTTPELLHSKHAETSEDDEQKTGELRITDGNNEKEFQGVIHV